MGVNGHSPIDSSDIEGLLRTGDKHLISIIGQRCGVYRGITLLAILTFFQLIPYPLLSGTQHSVQSQLLPVTRTRVMMSSMAATFTEASPCAKRGFKPFPPINSFNSPTNLMIFIKKLKP